MSTRARIRRPGRDQLTTREIAWFTAALLHCVDRFPGSLSRSALSTAISHIDTGTSHPLVSELNFTHVPGTMPSPLPTARALLVLIDELIEQDLLACSDTARPYLYLTRAGGRYLDNA